MHREIKADPTRGPIWVLVVEDETLIRLLCADILREAGFEVVAAAHGGEAVAILKTTDQIDFVFTDIMMPGILNGIGLGDWIRSHRPGLPIAYTSGVLQSRLAELGLKDEEVFFPKPASFDRLIPHINAAVATARAVQTAAACD